MQSLVIKINYQIYIDIIQINNETNKKSLVKNNNTPFSERKHLMILFHFFFLKAISIAIILVIVLIVMLNILFTFYLQ